MKRLLVNFWNTLSFFSPPYRVNGDLNSSESDIISSIIFYKSDLSCFLRWMNQERVYRLSRVTSWKIISWHFSRTGSKA